MSEIPSNWAVATLGDITELRVAQPGPKGDGTFTYVDISSIDNQKKEILEPKTLPVCEAPSRAKQEIQEDDVLVSMTRPNLNAVARVPKALSGAIASTGFHVLRAVEVEPEWISLRVRSKSFVAEMSDLVQGALYPAVRPSDIQAHCLSIPPLPEQRRIVAKIEALMARSRKAREALAEIPILLDHYRKAILNSAVTGSLTVDWRKTCASSQNKEQNFRDKEQKARKTARPATDGSLMSSLELSPIPSGWSWVQNRQLANGKPSAICAGPFGTIFKAKDFRPQGVPIIFLRHVGEGRFITSKPGFMDPEVWQMHHQPYSIYGGELLVTKLGDPPGTACIYPADSGTAMVTPDVMKMSVDGEVAETRYLMHFFNSSVSKQITRKLAFGVTRLRIDLAMFKDFPVPLPPLEEQREIVHRVDHLFSVLDGIAEAHKWASERLDVLDQSILAKAFRGELVPQDPADEPAEVLLSRIRGQKLTEKPALRRGRPRKGL